MLTLPSSVRVFVATAATDMRRSIDGLSAVVRNAWGHDVFSGHLFVFFGRRGDRVKVLAWDRGGFVLYYKRLERGRFRVPARTIDGQAYEMDATELAMLLDGIDVACVRRPARWTPPRPVTSTP